MKHRGAILVEVLIAVSICVVGLLALVQLGTKSINNSGYSARQAQATTYAANGLELVRQKKSAMGWGAFRSAYSGGDYCGQNLSVGTCAISQTPFQSTVRLTYGTQNGVETLTVVSLITWEEGNGQGTNRTVTVRQDTVFTRY